MLKIDVSYEYYYSDYGCGREGVVPAEDFEYFRHRASEEVDLRLCDEVSEEHRRAVSNAVCEVAELLYTSVRMNNVKSETIDGYSVTYPESGLISARITAIVEKHLSKTGLLYRGV